MRRSFLGVLMLCLLSIAGHAAEQTKPWRIAVGGAFCTGYIGLFAMHGMPRERITELELGDFEKLQQYDMIFLGARGMSPGAIGSALERYVREGGIVVAESGLPVPEQVLPGRRIGPAPHPNIRFIDTGTPLTQGLPELGLIRCISGNAMTIVPTPDAKVTVLAEFTEEETPQKYRGHFIVNGRGAPAIMMAEIGEGKLIYSAPSIAYNLSLRGQQFEPLICNLVKALTNNEVTDRMWTGTLGRDELVTLPSTEPALMTYPAPAGAPTAPPAGFETLAEADELTDFALSGKLAANAAARVLISHWSPALNRELVIEKGKVGLQRQENGGTVQLAAGTLPAGDVNLVVMRRSGLLTVEANRQTVLRACDGPPQQGALAVKGWPEAQYQPLDQVFFADDFMRESTTEDEWEKIGGRWEIAAAEGKPDMGANPFDFVATATDRAVALNGAWFWNDIAYDVSVRPGAQAAGLMVHYRAPDDCLALRLNFEKPTRLQLVRVKPTGLQVLAEQPVEVRPDDWCRLGLRASGEVLQGLLDGRVVLQARQTDSLCGRIGLYAEKGQVHFDDIEVRPWTAASLPADPLKQLMIVQGDWKLNQQVLSGSGSRGARAFPAWGLSGGDCAAEVTVRVGNAAAAGLHFRYADPSEYYLMALMNDKGKLRLRLYRHGDPGTILVEKPVSGDCNRWHKLQAEVRGGRLWAAVDGQPIIDVLDPGHRQGSVGLYVRGMNPASFKDFFAAQVEPDERLVDAPTPSFAGIIDRHTWAGRSGAWMPDPTNLDCFWHHAYLPADFNLQLGLHPTERPTVTTEVYLTRDRRADVGYTLALTRNWAAREVTLKLLRLGKPVAQGTAPVTPGQPFAVGLARRGTQLMLEVDRVPVVAYRDPQPPPNLDCLGLNQYGSLIHADDIAVASPLVNDYTFETAPTDWSVQNGTWEITSRWSCTPGWAWFSGANDNGFALISTKAAYAGDQDVVMYVAPKMMPAGDKRFTETFGDVYLSICSDGSASGGGYQIAFAGAGSSETVLRRQGEVVAKSTYRLPQSGEHNDWLRVALRKRGPRLTAWVWDVKVLEYDDTAPLDAGRIVIGTRNNGIMIPRVTVFGEQMR